MKHAPRRAVARHATNARLQKALCRSNDWIACCGLRVSEASCAVCHRGLGASGASREGCAKSAGGHDRTPSPQPPESHVVRCRNWRRAPGSANSPHLSTPSQARAPSAGRRAPSESASWPAVIRLPGKSTPPRSNRLALSTPRACRCA